MKHRKAILLLGIILLLLGGFYVYQNYQKNKIITRAIADGFVVVHQPILGQKITSPILVSGRARTYAGAATLRLTNNSGITLLETPLQLTPAERGNFSTFAEEVFIPPTNEKNLAVEVFWYSPKDRGELNKAIIPLVIESPSSLLVNIYLTRKTSTSLTSCARVVPVTRKISRTKKIEKAAILELLKGPQENELAAGYRTNIPLTANLLGIAIDQNTVYVDFAKNILDSHTSECDQIAMTSQIIETLRQFTQIRRVEILIEGETAQRPY